MVAESQQFEVESGLGRIRLDDYLFSRFSSLSRMYLRELVRTEQVLVNGEYPNIGTRLRRNDFIELTVDMSRGTAMQPENIPLDIIYEDESMVIVNKPAGMLVHPTHRDRNGTLLNALTFYLNREKLEQSLSNTTDRRGLIRPGLVHRLDRETSGLMVIAKSLIAHRYLAREFMKKRVEKRYVALVEGVFDIDEASIEQPIGRFAERKLWDVKHDGKSSTTRLSVIKTLNDMSLVQLEPVTGRTNQLRIHCASIGHPIVGDVQRRGRKFDRLCLHAFRLTLKHPLKSNLMSFESPIPERFDPVTEHVRAVSDNRFL